VDIAIEPSQTANPFSGRAPSPSEQAESIPSTYDPALEAEVIRALAEPQRIAAYPEGLTFSQPAKPEESMTVRELASFLSQAVQLTQKIQPKLLGKKHGFISRFLGRDLVFRAQVIHDIHQVLKLAEKIESAKDVCQQTLQDLDTSYQKAMADVGQIRSAIDTAAHYLNANPEAGKAADPIETSPRDRLARRISQLEILHGTFVMGAQQLKIARSQVLDVSERSQEFLQVLYPNWLRSLDFKIDTNDQASFAKGETGQ